MSGSDIDNGPIAILTSPPAPLPLRRYSIAHHAIPSLSSARSALSKLAIAEDTTLDDSSLSRSIGPTRSPVLARYMPCSLIFHEQIFAALIPALEAPEPRCVPSLPRPPPPQLIQDADFRRVRAHAATALINFCEGVECETLIPYLDSTVERLLKLLNPSADQPATQPKRYVQEQVITTLAMVADASEATFAKVRPPRREDRMRWLIGTGAALYIYYAVVAERHAKCERARVSEVAGKGNGVCGAHW